MNRMWTAAEIDFLKENIGKCKIDTIARQLARTESAVLLKAKRLKIANTKQVQGEISLGELALLIHKNRRTLYDWIQKGTFPARKRITRSKRAFYFIKPDEFWNWACQNQEKLNFSQIAPYAIPPEPEWVNKARKQKKVTEERGYKYWTMSEISSLLEYDQEGLKYSVIAEKLKRTPNSVGKQLMRINGLMEHKWK